MKQKKSAFLIGWGVFVIILPILLAPWNTNNIIGSLLCLAGGSLILGMELSK